MATTYSWMGEVLQTPHLVENVLEQTNFDRFRRMFDRSELLNRANAISISLNSQAGEVVIFSETFTDSHPIIGRYRIEDESDDITMELAILPEGPGVVFSATKRQGWVNRIQRCCGLHPEEKKCVVLKIVINPELVADADIRQWFTYLLSGLHHSFKPEPVGPLLMESLQGTMRPNWQVSRH